jgi:hypothetical protein
MVRDFERFCLPAQLTESQSWLGSQESEARSSGAPNPLATSSLPRVPAAPAAAGELMRGVCPDIHVLEIARLVRFQTYELQRLATPPCIDAAVYLPELSPTQRSPKIGAQPTGKLRAGPQCLADTLPVIGRATHLNPQATERLRHQMPILSCCCDRIRRRD